MERLDVDDYQVEPGAKELIDAVLGRLEDLYQHVARLAAHCESQDSYIQDLEDRFVRHQDRG